MNDSAKTPPLVRHAAVLDWQPSPGGEVERKRFHLHGVEESGQVSSLVRYLPGARFPEHPHPDGEEIFVLEGVFSDLSGNYAAGSHLLNPEGYVHAPWSDPGCLLFVKLRQYAGAQRSQQVLHTDRLAWKTADDGCEQLTLQRGDTPGELRRLERWSPDMTPATRHWPDGVEVFVISGDFEDQNLQLQTFDWAVFPPGHSHQPRTRNGCTLYFCTPGLSAV